jgi:hypothetical protein
MLLFFSKKRERKGKRPNKLRICPFIFKTPLPNGAELELPKKEYDKKLETMSHSFFFPSTQ